MKNDQFVPSILSVKQYPDYNIQDDLYSTQDKTIAQLIEELHEEKKQENQETISNSG